MAEKQYTLGIDIGSSSVKVALMEVSSGICAAAVSLPQQEMTIHAPQSGWAEQDPDLWWEYASQGVRTVITGLPAGSVQAIGITYQMHGLVCLDEAGEPLRDAIIWCDSRAVGQGQRALETLGRERCLENLLNSPGNFTAAKLAWVRENEPAVFARVHTFMLPGDYILYKLSGQKSTTHSGLSEQILWDFKADARADFVAQCLGIDPRTIPENLPGIGVQAQLSAEVAATLGLEAGIPIAYRAGDQPNNAFSLNVMEPGEIAATGGTSGVVYGVIDQPKADPLSRVNTFLHVNHRGEAPRYGVLLCINAVGILNAWIKRTVAPQLSYPEANAMAATAPVGSDGVVMLPFGNGAERMLENRYTGAAALGMDLNRHSQAHLLRAAQEGIAFAFRYGIDIMRESGLLLSVIRAGEANLFLSPIFRETLATLCGADIELYNTDGALGAARGAALGAGLYRNRDEAFASLRCVGRVKPNTAWKQPLEEAYTAWKRALEIELQTKK